MRLIDADAAIDTLKELTANGTNKGMVFGEDAVHRIEILPSVQPDIIRCKDCKHWNHQFKTASGNGLGSCDFHDVSLVTSEGFCYWAEKRGKQE